MVTTSATWTQYFGRNASLRSPSQLGTAVSVIPEWCSPGKVSVSGYSQTIAQSFYPRCSFRLNGSCAASAKQTSCTERGASVQNEASDDSTLKSCSPREAEAAWFDPKIDDPAKLLPLLKPYPSELMEFYAVDRIVNSQPTILHNASSRFEITANGCTRNFTVASLVRLATPACIVPLMWGRCHATDALAHTPAIKRPPSTTSV